MPHNQTFIDQFIVTSHLIYEAIAAGDDQETALLFDRRQAILAEIMPSSLTESDRRALAEADSMLRRRVSELQSEIRRDFELERQRRSGRTAYSQGLAQSVAQSA